MKVCVVGAGAIGGWIGARLARAGSDVSLVARGLHLEALRTDGLTLVTGDLRENFDVRASEDPAELGEQDVVFLTLKAHGIAAMLASLEPLLGAETMVVPAINGIPWWYFYKEGGPLDGTNVACLDPDGSMLRALDPARVIGCVVHGSAEVIEPGVVANTAGNRLIVGEPSNAVTPRVERLAALLRSGDFDVIATDHIRREIWAKLIGNTSYNPVAALTLARMNEINASPELLNLIAAMMEESMRVSAAYGIKIPMTVEERIEVSRKIGSSKISMHQDVEKGRPLEVDAIIGSVVELARKAGVETPMTDAVYALIRERARHVGAA